MDLALRLAALVIRLMEWENRTLEGMSAEDFQKMQDCKDATAELAASILERDDRWALQPLRLFDSCDN